MCAHVCGNKHVSPYFGHPFFPLHISLVFRLQKGRNHIKSQYLRGYKKQLHSLNLVVTNLMTDPVQLHLFEAFNLYSGFYSALKKKERRSNHKHLKMKKTHYYFLIFTLLHTFQVCRQRLHWHEQAFYNATTEVNFHVRILKSSKLLTRQLSIRSLPSVCYLI